MSTSRKILGMGIGPAMQTIWIWIFLLLLGPGAIASAQPLSQGKRSSPFMHGSYEESKGKKVVESADPRAMTEGEWEALAQKVSVNLDWIGIQMGVLPEARALYVPALTQEYLQAFHLSLAQGATKQQADILASQYIFARIRQLAAESGSAPGSQGEDGCVYSRGGSFCAGSDGFRSFSFR